MEISASPQAGLGTRQLSLPRIGWQFGLGMAALLMLSLIAGGVGSVYISPDALLKIILDKAPLISIDHTWPTAWDTIIWEIRFPRVVLAALVGGALAIAGATYQGIFRNPLADPYLIGVASGAGLGAALILVTDVPLYFHGFSLLPIAAFIGALAAVAVAFMIAKQQGALPLTTLILAGVAIASFASAITGLLKIKADSDVRPLIAWLLGGLNGSDWRDVQIVLPYLVLGIVVMLAYSRVLNMFQLDEREAAQMGVNVGRTKVVIIIMASLTTAAAVSVSGLIGFVGLISPHAVRLIWGHDNRVVLPMSLISGAGFLVLADLAARTVSTPTELPVGVVTAFCGAPFFLVLLYRRRSLMA